MAKNNTQTYFVACFACCREIYLWKSHSGCIAATSKAEAEKIYQEEDDAQRRIKEKQMSLEEQNARIKAENDRLKALIEASEPKPEDLEGQPAARGFSLVEDNITENFMLVFGAKPGYGVKIDTKLVKDVMSCFHDLYDKTCQIV